MKFKAHHFKAFALLLVKVHKIEIEILQENTQSVKKSVLTDGYNFGHKGCAPNNQPGPVLYFQKPF